jgi:hypothetical protein
MASAIDWSLRSGLSTREATNRGVRLPTTKAASGRGGLDCAEPGTVIFTVKVRRRRVSLGPRAL